MSLKITDHPSPNFGPRAAGKKISFLILHYTAVPGDEALRILTTPASEASAHYFIDEDGSVLRLVPEDKRAWHAGKSFWAGETDVNSCSIGIEIQNLGHENGLPEFPAVQMKAAAELCRGIIERHKILPQHVLAHSDIAPARKRDPGERFPWKALAAQGIGLWPDVTAADKTGTVFDIKSLLTKYGYDPAADARLAITAFQRHFVPEVFEMPNKAGTADLDSVYILNALLRLSVPLRKQGSSVGSPADE